MQHFALILVGLGIFVVWLTVRQPAPTPEEKAIAERNVSREAADRLRAAKAQIDKKNYVAAKSTLESITQSALLAQSAQSVEAKQLLEKIDSLATRQAQSVSLGFSVHRRR
jgi:hypothetical protein